MTEAEQTAWLYGHLQGYSGGACNLDVHSPDVVVRGYLAGYKAGKRAQAEAGQ